MFTALLLKVNEVYRFRVNAAENVEVITFKNGWVFDVHQFIDFASNFLLSVQPDILPYRKQQT